MATDKRRQGQKMLGEDDQANSNGYTSKDSRAAQKWNQKSAREYGGKAVQSEQSNDEQKYMHQSRQN